MNTFTRIAFTAGLLSVPVLPALAQNGTPLTGITSPTPSTQPPAATQVVPTQHATAAKHAARPTTRRATTVSTPASKKSTTP